MFAMEILHENAVRRVEIAYLSLNYLHKYGLLKVFV